MDAKESSPLLPVAPARTAKPLSCTRLVLLHAVAVPFGLVAGTVVAHIGGFHVAMATVAGRFLLKTSHDAAAYGLSNLQVGLSREEMLAYGKVGMTGGTSIFAVWVVASAGLLAALMYRIRAEECADNDAENQPEGPKMTLQERFKAKFVENRPQWEGVFWFHHWLSAALVAPVGLALTRLCEGEGAGTLVDDISYLGATASFVTGALVMGGLHLASRRIFGRGKQGACAWMKEDRAQPSVAGEEKL
ncbi:hypothetical protein EIP91_001329 [Steccherinum ochraceum]|uniref:Uncharacterized protein n=1 Tax=Steccherinum ochraceum TaxID=92696 RepID=A0A4R0RMN3_9APHY|nr:hypothetical protein EIP91_001329 [Steccherinum ochraceum]